IPNLHEAQYRHAAYYESVLRRAESQYQQEGENSRQGLELFDLEVENIRRGQAWAALHADSNEAATKLCSSYLWSGGSLLSIRLHARESLRWAQSARAAAHQLKDRITEAANLSL